MKNQQIKNEILKIEKKNAGKMSKINRKVKKNQRLTNEDIIIKNFKRASDQNILACCEFLGKDCLDEVSDEELILDVYYAQYN